MKNGIDKPLNYQLELLEEILMKNKTLKTILEKLETLKLENYYVAAGEINQTVFNYLHGYDFEHEINDYDIVYFDEDTSYEKEDTIIKKIMNEMGPINAKLDIKNQARVHLWYEKKFWS